MKLNLETLQNKIVPVANKVQSNTYLSSIMDGMSGLLAPILVGAIATLLNNLPFEPYQAFLETIHIKPYLAVATNFTTDIIALFAVFLVAYNLVRKFDMDGVIPGVYAIVCFLVLTPLAQVEVDGEMTNFISFEWLGAAGLFVAIILGLVVGRLYVAIVRKGLILRMPEGVPPTIQRTFSGLVPGFIIVALMLIVKAIFNVTPWGSVHAVIYTFLQTPLQNLGGSIWALLLAMFVVHLLWLFGIHGMLVVLSVMMPIWISLDLQNLEAYQAGEPLPNIVGLAFVMVYILLGGSGATLGLNLLMLFRAKSQRFKTLGKLAIPAGICGINEPIMFGTPIILNPIMAIPFILSPLLCALVAYIVTAIGIVPPLMGANVPLGTPIIIIALLQGSWKFAVLEILLVIMTIFIYYPFFRIADNQAYAQEQGEEQPAEA